MYIVGKCLCLLIFVQLCCPCLLALCLFLCSRTYFIELCVNTTSNLKPFLACVHILYLANTADSDHSSALVVGGTAYNKLQWQCLSQLSNMTPSATVWLIEVFLIVFGQQWPIMACISDRRSSSDILTPSV